MIVFVAPGRGRQQTVEIRPLESHDADAIDLAQFLSQRASAVGEISIGQ